MPALKILPGNIANMIAAGEVVQRPASVVKELVENAVDAGATSISVVLTDAGRTLIQVMDDGCGMSAEDAVLCFERHATSKIATADDLGNILTYGFRGEALPSIASVAEVTLKTRRPKDELATMVNINGFNHVETSRCSSPVGSNFAVRNLFYNVPARRKFLKSDTVELRHCVEELDRVALTRPDIAFSLIHNGKTIISVKPAKSLKFRVLDLMGPNVTGDIVDIDSRTHVVDVSGFVGRPDSAKKTLGNQFFFVNGRYFRSAYFHKAVMKAYEELIPDGVTPSYFLYLKADPQTIDVNIHPAKTEMKFEDDSVIFQVIYASVKEALGRNSFAASIDFDSAGEVDVPAFGRNFEEYHGLDIPAAAVDPDYNPFLDMGDGSASKAPRFDFPTVSKSENYGKLFEEERLPLGQCLIVQGKYIVTQVKAALMTVNIRRARERVLYERFLHVLEGAEQATQVSLFPVQVKVGVENKLIFDENADELQKMGFDISAFGNDTIVVGGVPEGYSCEEGKVETLVSDLLLILSEQKGALKEMMDSSKAARFALLGAAGSSTLSSPFEAQRLVQALLACDNSELTPGGKRIMILDSVQELDKKFD